MAGLVLLVLLLHRRHLVLWVLELLQLVYQLVWLLLGRILVVELKQQLVVTQVHNLGRLIPFVYAESLHWLWVSLELALRLSLLQRGLRLVYI